MIGDHSGARIKALWYSLFVLCKKLEAHCLFVKKKFQSERINFRKFDLYMWGVVRNQLE